MNNSQAIGRGRKRGLIMAPRTSYFTSWHLGDIYPAMGYLTIITNNAICLVNTHNDRPMMIDERVQNTQEKEKKIYAFNSSKFVLQNLLKSLPNFILSHYPTQAATWSDFFLFKRGGVGQHSLELSHWLLRQTFVMKGRIEVDWKVNSIQMEEVNG